MDPTRTASRERAAEEASALVEPGMIVGLGSGDTAARAIRALGRRVRSGLEITGVATSRAAGELAAAEGLRLVEPDEVAAIDLTLDGADEIDPALRLLKGAGGALTREKVVARASRRLIIVADESKWVQHLGEKRRLPVEILPFGARWTIARLQVLGLDPALRRVGEEPLVTDGGGYLVDCAWPIGAIPEALAEALDRTCGVIEHGLFLTEAEAAYVGYPDRVERRARLPG